jgi:hypothetical protein
MVVKIKSRVMAPLALLVPELEEAAQVKCYLAHTLVVKQIFTSKAKIKVLKLLRSESSIKMVRPAISSILRANS